MSVYKASSGRARKAAKGHGSVEGKARDMFTKSGIHFIERELPKKGYRIRVQLSQTPKQKQKQKS